MKSGFRLAAVLLAVICLGAAAFLGWKILQTEHEYRAGISAYDRIAEIAGGTDGTGHIFYEDIKDYEDAEDYIGTVRKISKNQFVDDALRETYYNSKICSTKMHRFKIGLWTAFASIVLILICALCYFLMYHH